MKEHQWEKLLQSVQTATIYEFEKDFLIFQKDRYSLKSSEKCFKKGLLEQKNGDVCNGGKHIQILFD